MLDAYGLAAAHLSELKRTQDEARARYDRGLATAVVRRPGVIHRLWATLFRAAPPRPSPVPAASPVAAPVNVMPAPFRGGCGSPARCAA